MRSFDRSSGQSTNFDDYNRLQCRARSCTYVISRRDGASKSSVPGVWPCHQFNVTLFRTFPHLPGPLLKKNPAWLPYPGYALLCSHSSCHQRGHCPWQWEGPWAVRFGTETAAVMACHPNGDRPIIIRCRAVTARTTSTGIGGDPVHVLGPAVVSHGVSRDHDAYVTYATS